MKLAMLGTGKIVQDALLALREAPEITVDSVFARPQSRAKAEKLAAEWQIPHVYTDMQALLASDCDTVYVGLANHVHVPYAEMALRGGHDVIMEKPFAPCGSDVAAMRALAKKQGRLIIEAVTPFFLPNFAVIRKALPKLGRIRAVQANYSQYSSRYDAYRAGTVLPAFDPARFGGALYDINIYNLNLIIALFGKPQEAHYTANCGFNGIDTSGVATLRYKDFSPRPSARRTARAPASSPCRARTAGCASTVRPTSCRASRSLKAAKRRPSARIATRTAWSMSSKPSRASLPSETHRTSTNISSSPKPSWRPSMPCARALHCPSPTLTERVGLCTKPLCGFSCSIHFAKLCWENLFCNAKKI